MKIKLYQYLFRIIIAFFVSAGLFCFVPFIYLKRGSIGPSANRIHSKPIIMEVKKNPPKHEKVKRQILREIVSRKETMRKSANKIKFTPDLSIGQGTGVGVSQEYLENMVFEEGETDELPVAIFKTPVDYPYHAKKLGIEGTVEIIVLIDSKGKIANIEFLHLPDECFRQPVRQALSQWRFKPATVKRIPVKIRMKQKMEFKLK